MGINVNVNVDVNESTLSCDGRDGDVASFASTGTASVGAGRVGSEGASRGRMTLSGLAGALALTVMTTPAFAGVDWATGLVTADGLGVADRHAPSPAAAREPARRAAEVVARKQLAAQLPALPLAAGGTLKDKLGDKQVAVRIAQAVERAVVVAATPHTDGSWNVTLGVPIEAVRQALEGPRKIAAADGDPPVVVVEGMTAKPAVGVTIGGITGAALWVKEVPAWAKDAPRIKATATKAGAIELATKQGGAATLFVLVAK